MKDTDAVDMVFLDAISRMRMGREKYGEFCAATDPRDMLQEAEEEALDGIVYLAMHILKLREMRGRWNLRMTDRLKVDMPSPGCGTVTNKIMEGLK